MFDDNITFEQPLRENLPREDTPREDTNMLTNTTRMIKDNILLQFIKDTFDKYKLIIIITIVILIVIYIESNIAINTCDNIYKLNKRKIMKICYNRYYLYVYNSDTFSNTDVVAKINQLSDNRSGNYIKYIIPEHIFRKIENPMKTINNNIKSLFNSATPINNITNGIINSQRIKEYINPLSIVNSLDTHWVMMLPDNTNINCFVNENKLYIS